MFNTARKFSLYRKWQLNTAIFIIFLLGMLLASYLIITLAQQLKFIYLGTPAQGEVVDFSKANHQLLVKLLFKDSQDKFHEIFIEDGTYRLGEKLDLYYINSDSENNFAILKPGFYDAIWKISILIISLGIFYIVIRLYRFAQYVIESQQLGYQYFQNCQHCKKNIYYNCYDSFAKLYPHAYCHLCSNVFWRKSDRDKVHQTSHTSQLLIIINTALPKCPCGGRFQIDANPKCPHCKIELAYHAKLIERLTDSNVMVVENATEIFDYN